jgi:hypothetical protein
VAECTYCKAETHLYDSGIPVCVTCAVEIGEGKKPGTGRDTRSTLLQELLAATARAESASETFNKVMGEVPTGTPHPDGVQRIHNASREMSNAREQMMQAHHRLNEFIASGVVPEDLVDGSKNQTD